MCMHLFSAAACWCWTILLFQFSHATCVRLQENDTLCHVYVYATCYMHNVRLLAAHDAYPLLVVLADTTIRR